MTQSDTDDRRIEDIADILQSVVLRVSVSLF